MPTQAKITEVESLVQDFTGAKSVVLADFVGMDVATITELRRRCRAEKITVRVAKNTLSRRALASVGMSDLESMLEGPTAIAVAKGDELAAVRVLTAFAKEKEKPRVKGGMVGGRVYTLAEIKTLASLPARNELIAQLLATFESPMTQVVGMMGRLTSDLISILDQLAERKGGGAAAAPTSGGEAPAGESAEPAAEAGGEAGGDGTDGEAKAEEA
jgi:large subunit ribosomal protein L10